MTNNYSEFLKKLKYQSNYRGCKETELIFGNFSNLYLDKLSYEELEDYYDILELTDAKLVDIFMYKKNIPDNLLNKKIYHLILESMQ